ncbi:MAG: DUF6882 domain-containing protein [Pseudomonadota bacterium]
MVHTYQNLLEKHLARAWSCQDRLSDQIGGEGWECDLQEGTLSFSNGQVFRIGLLGSYGEGAGTWLWAWANQGMAHLPEPVLAAANGLRALGEEHQIVQLTEAEFEADETDCALMAMLAVGHLGQGAFYRGPYEGGAAYFIIEPLEALTGPTDVARIPRLISECTGFGLPSRAVVEGFFRAERFDLESAGDKLVATRGETSFSVSFDEEGRVAEVSAKLAAESHAAPPDQPARGGVLSRLFGRGKRDA